VLSLLNRIGSDLYFSVTVIVIRRKYALINQSSNANHCCYWAQECVLQCFSCLLEQGLLRSRDKISGPPNPEKSQLPLTNPYPRGITFNLTLFNDFERL
jgi:hypothetical protein